MLSEELAGRMGDMLGRGLSKSAELYVPSLSDPSPDAKKPPICRQYQDSAEGIIHHLSSA